MLATRLGADERERAVLRRPADRGRHGEDKAAMLINYAGTDERINTGWPRRRRSGEQCEMQAHLRRHAARFQRRHTPRYDAAAAKLAWERTIAHFNKK